MANSYASERLNEGLLEAPLSHFYVLVYVPTLRFDETCEREVAIPATAVKKCRNSCIALQPLLSPFAVR